MALAPLYVQKYNPGSTEAIWAINDVYKGSDGRGDPFTNYAAAKKTFDGPAVSSGYDDSQDKLFNYLDKAADKAFGYQTRAMGLSNEYRTKEGATQGQMDAQAFKRLSAELETRKYMQEKGADLTNWQRDKDQQRAVTAFKSFGN